MLMVIFLATKSLMETTVTTTEKEGDDSELLTTKVNGSWLITIESTIAYDQKVNGSWTITIESTTEDG